MRTLPTCVAQNLGFLCAEVDRGTWQHVEMKNIYAIDDLHVKMGTGNDEFKIRNSSALNPAFDGGPGYDTIHNLPNLFDEIAASVNFEVFIP